ncbi:MAG: 2,3-bisphosphoglycerate-independent phosphoglycerate mutase [Planctomycetota bacterium]
MPTVPGPAMLIILDGVGLRDAKEFNAVKLAKTPTLDRLRDSATPYTELITCGTDVGLPKGQMGNSEVGHMNLGAGRVVWQEIMALTRQIVAGSFYENKALVAAVEFAKKSGGRLHLMGLVSDGGVHSADEHIYALLRMAGQHGLMRERVVVHAFTDGRDTPPMSGQNHIALLHAKMNLYDIGVIGTVIGRYWAMDRDKRWARTESAWKAIVDGNAPYKATDPVHAVKAAYDRPRPTDPTQKQTDEFIEPTVIVDTDGQPLGRVQDGDAIVFFNFRADRARQLSRAFVEPDFKEFQMAHRPNIKYVCMTQYIEGLPADIVLPKTKLDGLLGGVVSQAGLKQMRIAETEKYPHVTFFFNGGFETPFPGEERILVPSPQDVPTYDLKPEMSAAGVRDKILPVIAANQHKLIVLNFANGDMVGHTGVLPAAIKAVETVDGCLGALLDQLAKVHGAAFVTADHGNCELMWDYENNCPHTAHTTFNVPCFVVGEMFKGAKLRSGGRLADVSPTLLKMLDLKTSPQMEGESIL